MANDCLPRDLKICLSFLNLGQFLKAIQAPKLIGDLVAKSCLTLATPWTVACQAPLSMGFSRQEYWSGLPFPTSGPLPDPGIEPASPAFAGAFFTAEPPEKPKDTSSHPNIPLVHSLNR